MKQCIVSGMDIKNPAAAPRSEYDGAIYYFCCKGCKAKFDRHPEKYLNGLVPHAHDKNHNCGCC